MEVSSYELSRNWFDWSYENPELITPTHGILYFFIIEHCNRLGWKEKFGLPTTMAKEAIGVKSYKTYISALNDLVDWGFIKLVQKSTNQYSSNIVALVKNTKAHTKALTKATTKHTLKQVQSIDSIDKPINHITIEPNNIDERKLKFATSLNSWVMIYGKEMLDNFCDYWTEPNKSKTKMKFELQQTWDLNLRLKTWANRQKDFKPKNGTPIATTQAPFPMLPLPIKK